jgi:hypothetical protein
LKAFVLCNYLYIGMQIEFKNHDCSAQSKQTKFVYMLTDKVNNRKEQF